MPWIPPWLRRHPLLATAGLVAVAAAADHRFGRPADDWSRYDHRTFSAVASSGDAIQLDDGTPVHLLGVTDPTSDAAGWLARRVADRPITLLLPTIGTRDAARRLLAYVFSSDDLTCLNVAIVREGMAYADRRGDDAMAGAIDAAETDARRRRRGLWGGLRFEQMPPWRQAWLRSRAATQP
jgi:hypothetical protein